MKKMEKVTKWISIITNIITSIAIGVYPFIFYDKIHKEMTNNQLRIENELRPR